MPHQTPCPETSVRIHVSIIRNTFASQQPLGFCVSKEKCKIALSRELLQDLKQSVVLIFNLESILRQAGGFSYYPQRFSVSARLLSPPLYCVSSLYLQEFHVSFWKRLSQLSPLSLHLVQKLGSHTYLPILKADKNYQ